MLAANSCSRPGNDARPRSPASQIAGRRVDQHEFELVLVDARGDFLGRYSYGNANSTARKPACAASAEPFEERHFVEEKREIGGQSAACVTWQDAPVESARGAGARRKVAATLIPTPGVCRKTATFASTVRRLSRLGGQSGG